MQEDDRIHAGIQSVVSRPTLGSNATASIRESEALGVAPDGDLRANLLDDVNERGESGHNNLR